MNFKKLIKGAILSSTLLFSFTSCGFFDTGEEGTSIKEILTEVNENGDTLVTIVYIDEEREPVEFIIPKGEDGIIGAGIKDVTKDFSEDGNFVILTITYTDDREPSIIEVPIINGVDGISIENIVPTYNDDGSITLKVTYIGNALPPLEVTIPAPEKGDKGDGILSHEIVENQDGSKTITFKYTNEEIPDTVITIPAPEKGDTGNGIAFVMATEDGNSYKLTFYFTDGSDQTVTFTRPTEPNTWHSGVTDPNLTPNLGKNGDFYIDKYTLTIYQKSGGRWIPIATLNNSKEEHLVTFDPNGGNFVSTTTDYQFYIEHGNTFYATDGYSIPSVYKEGYTFVGWFTSKQNDPSYGQFTDLTPVLSDMTLYARWEQN